MVRMSFYYLKGFAPMPPAPFMHSAVGWRRRGSEAKWSGKVEKELCQHAPKMKPKWASGGIFGAAWRGLGGFLETSRGPGGLWREF